MRGMRALRGMRGCAEVRDARDARGAPRTPRSMRREKPALMRVRISRCQGASTLSHRRPRRAARHRARPADGLRTS